MLIQLQHATNFATQTFSPVDPKHSMYEKMPIELYHSWHKHGNTTK